MGIMNWLASKAMGVPTVDESCHDSVLVFLTKNNIQEPTFSFLRAETSYTNPRFKHRVYFGTGAKGSEHVAYLLHVNEDIPRPDGAIFDINSIRKIETIYRDWLATPHYLRGSFYSFALHELGGKLEALERI